MFCGSGRCRSKKSRRLDNGGNGCSSFQGLAVTGQNTTLKFRALELAIISRNTTGTGFYFQFFSRDGALRLLTVSGSVLPGLGIRMYLQHWSEHHPGR
jgi:hypothetical protein